MKITLRRYDDGKGRPNLILEPSDTQTPWAILHLGMTKKPYGWPLMAPAFFGFAHFAIVNPDFLNDFEEDTGINLHNNLPRTPIDKMIDDATGHMRENCSRFLDWLVVNYWGEADE